MILIKTVMKEFVFSAPARLAVLLFSITILLTGCFALRPHAELKYSSTAVLESLSSNISLKYTSSDQSLSGSGYLMYRKPDQMRIVILSPFGNVLQEVYMSGEFITIIDQGNGVAFSGTKHELPDSGAFSGWRYIHWLIDIDPPDALRSNSTINRINRFGNSETVVFEDGLLISKLTASGNQVKYAKFISIMGTSLPLEIKYTSATNDKITIELEEPEVNVVLADGSFSPNLGKLHIYPLSALK